ncbi:sensor domain-containing protein [Brevibacillus ginsengisoli]|uniref:sensor domain-containing protein n=1 Tax=Brevibacillus ginsengisoli TaxID=363854 RepID=UPI003CEE3C4B
MINANYSDIKLIASLGKLREICKDWPSAEPYIETLEKDMYESLQELSDLKWAMDLSTIVAITDVTGKILYANDKFCEVSKYSRDELVGRNHKILNSDYHDQEFFQNLWETIMRGEVWCDEIRNKAKDGSYYWVKTTVVPILDEDGKPYQFISLRTDITQGKIAEEKYRDSLKNDFHRTVDALHSLVYKMKKTKDGKKVYTLFEGKLVRQLELKTSDPYEKTALEVYGAELAEELEKVHDRAFSGECVTYTVKYNNGYYQTTLSPIIMNGKVQEIIGSSSDVTELINAENIIRHMAYHDPLTDLMNRYKFIEDLSQAIKHAERNQEKLAIMFLDLDRFKQINDSLGHSVGDNLLRHVSKCLEDAILQFKGCSLYRVGGDEFIFLLRNLSEKSEAMNIAKLLLSVFHTASCVDEHEFFITGSIGISIYPESGQDGETLMKNADTAMYYAKNRGRNTFSLYTPEMNEKYNEHLQLEVDLRKAIKNEELFLVYQPKVDIRSGLMVGMEALVRWVHPTFGFISPAQFIPIAEETGLIVSLGEWVLHKACQQNKDWIDAGYPSLCVSVNVSALQIQRTNFVETVKRIIGITGINPALVELEITENSMMENTEECIGTLMKLKQIGISISIDDFGTGYSSLSYLKRFPINALKIDQSFVREIMSDADDAAIVKTVINLAHNMNLKVIAEGVESQEAFEYLKKQRCDQLQGYYISKPLPSSEFEQLLVKQKESINKSGSRHKKNTFA